MRRMRSLPGREASDTTPPRTHIARSIVDAAAWAHTDADARAIVASAFQQRRVTVAEVGAVLRQLRRIRRRSLIVETAGYAARGAHSVSEVEFVKLCHRNRLPPPRSQTMRRDREGRLRYLDAHWPQFGVHVEVDGAWHLDVRTWWADMQRQNALWVAGDRVLRFPAWAIRHDPESVIAQLRAALTAGGWVG
jgi:hypothetical protein